MVKRPMEGTDMNARKGELARKALALVTGIALVAGSVPAPALAYAAEAAVGTEATGSSTDAAPLAAAKVTNQELVDLAKSVASSAIKLDPMGAAQTILSWGAGKLIEGLFGEDVEEEQQATLEDVLLAIDSLSTAVSDIQDTMNAQQLDGILNNLNPVLGRKTTYTVYAALRDIDAKQAAGTYTEAQAKQLVRNALTESIGVTKGAEGSVENTYDLFAWNLWKAMTDAYHVTASGKAQDLTLMQVWYEHLRYKYHWEHQAYDEWATFQAQCVSLLATSLTLEKASLQVRIELLDEWNAAHPDDLRSTGALESYLATIQDCINQMSGYQGKDAGGNDVSYPGLFNDAAWDAQYWLYKQRDESERYYWTHGHEVLFYALVNTQHVPGEWPGASTDPNSTCYGIVKSYTYGSYGIATDFDAYVNPKYWYDFIKYSRNASGSSTSLWASGFEPLASSGQLKAMYKDYRGEESLYHIFMSEDEGNFQGLDESNVQGAWYFVVDPEGGDGPYFKKTSRWEGEARIHCLVSADASDDTANLCSYTGTGTTPNPREHFIGIGVKREGPETYDPSGFGTVPAPGPKNGWEKTDDGSWAYYVDGELGRTAWLHDSDGQWYYMRDSVMQVGWFRDADGAWYYLEERHNGHFGAMLRSAWVKSGGAWYYLGADGALLRGTITPDGYRVDANGRWVG